MASFMLSMQCSCPDQQGVRGASGSFLFVGRAPGGRRPSANALCAAPSADMPFPRGALAGMKRVMDRRSDFEPSTGRTELAALLSATSNRDRGAFADLY